MPRLQSLHAKILLGYVLVGLLFVALIASALVDFRRLEKRIDEQQHVADLHDEMRHARRMEKNYLLFRKNDDLADAIAHTDSALRLLEGLPLQISDAEIQEVAEETLAHYRQLLIDMANADRYGSAPLAASDDLLVTGSRVLSLGEKLDADARAILEDAVSAHHRSLRRTIFATISLALLAGILVTRSVVRPLRAVENSLARVATGEAGRLDRPSNDREVGSLTDAINRTLTELDERQKLIVRSSRLVSLGTMLSGVAHELNNPLSNISTSCQILLEEVEDLPAGERQALLAQIDGEVLRAQRIVSVLLDFARERQYSPSPTPLAALLEEVLRLTRSQRPADARVSIDLAADLLIDVDPRRFQQVLINLLQNAAAAIGPGGSIALRAWRDAAGTCISVADDGPGIAADDLPRIFDPFFSTKPVGSGTGLGLFIVHEIVSQHGGTVRVANNPERGCCFTVCIPDHPPPGS